jgi:hypothetical protein
VFLQLCTVGGLVTFNLNAGAVSMASSVLSIVLFEQNVNKDSSLFCSF